MAGEMTQHDLEQLSRILGQELVKRGVIIDGLLKDGMSLQEEITAMTQSLAMEASTDAAAAGLDARNVSKLEYAAGVATHFVAILVGSGFHPELALGFTARFFSLHDNVDERELFIRLAKKLAAAARQRKPWWRFW